MTNFIQVFCCDDYKQYLQGLIDYNSYMNALNRKLANDFRYNKTVVSDSTVYIQKMKRSKALLARKIEEIKYNKFH